MFTNAITDLLDDCSDWPVVVIATTRSRSSLSISLNDLFVHCTDFDVRFSVCVSLYICLSVCLCVYLSVCCPLLLPPDDSNLSSLGQSLVTNTS